LSRFSVGQAFAMENFCKAYVVADPAIDFLLSLEVEERIVADYIDRIAKKSDESRRIEK
jgi:hypothetical protein